MNLRLKTESAIMTLLSEYVGKRANSKRKKLPEEPMDRHHYLQSVSKENCLDI